LVVVVVFVVVGVVVAVLRWSALRNPIKLHNFN